MLNDELKNLRDAARAASARAYIPYSRFPVGAALKVATDTESSGYILGCNVENAAYSMTICAERNALAQSVARGVTPGSLKILGIYMPGEQLYSPCGECRQVIAELMSPDAQIYAFCDGDDYHCWSREQLLPDGFGFR